MTYTEKLRKYAAGEYVMPVPPVHTTYWTTVDWITWIDTRGMWTATIH